MNKRRTVLAGLAVGALLFGAGAFGVAVRHPAPTAVPRPATSCRNEIFKSAPSHGTSANKGWPISVSRLPSRAGIHTGAPQC